MNGSGTIIIHSAAQAAGVTEDEKTELERLAQKSKKEHHLERCERDFVLRVIDRLLT
jgi:hypothetical protein